MKIPPTSIQSPMELVLTEMEKMRHTLESKISLIGQKSIMDLTLLQLRVCILLHHCESLKMSDIAKSLNLKTSGATQIIDKLLEKNMIIRTQDPEDRRIVKISISKSGQAIMQKIRKDHIQIISELYSKLSPDETQTMLNLLQKINS